VRLFDNSCKFVDAALIFISNDLDLMIVVSYKYVSKLFRGRYFNSVTNLSNILVIPYVRTLAKPKSVRAKRNERTKSC